jgi:hypothetical protein
MLAYLWEHIVAFIALFTTVAHITLRYRARKKYLVAALSSLEKFVPLIIAAMSKGAEFESGKPITLAVPADSITLDLTAEGLGKVTVGESGGMLTFTRVV